MVQVLYHPDSFSDTWGPALSVQCARSENSGDGYVGERKSQLEWVRVGEERDCGQRDVGCRSPCALAGLRPVSPPAKGKGLNFNPLHVVCRPHTCLLAQSLIP